MRFAFIVNALPAQLGFFMLGALISQQEAQLRRLPDWLWLALLFTFVPFFGHWNSWLGLNPSIASGLGLAGLFMLMLKRPCLPWKLPHLLGEISYPVYLLHVPVIITVFTRWNIKGTAGLAACLALLAASSLALHVLVERPGMALGRRLIER